MFDCHYDLLTYIYMNQNNIEMIKRYCNKVYKQDNITGSIFNLFYMSTKEMKEELNIEKEEINVIENLRLVDGLIRKNNIIPTNVDYIYGIEGLDYLERIEDLAILYKLGLRAVNVTWSNQNKFGGGVKTKNDVGLTSLGKELVEALIDLKIAIDLSHANEKTFFDIINICKKEKNKKPIVFASHSNAKKVCDVVRNLTDDQIIAIAELGGTIGVVSIKEFCKKPFSLMQNYVQEYADHINYVKNLLGNVEHIAVSTDDMKYYKYNQEHHRNINVFEHDEVANKTRELLIANHYTKEEIEKVMVKNFYNKILSNL